MTPRSKRIRIWLLRALIAITVVLIASNIAMRFYGPEIVLFVLNAKEGRWPWSPAEVEYHEGMTLCPGQSTTTPFIIREHKSSREDRV